MDLFNRLAVQIFACVMRNGIKLITLDDHVPRGLGFEYTCILGLEYCLKSTIVLVSVANLDPCFFARISVHIDLLINSYHHYSCSIPLHPLASLSSELMPSTATTPIASLRYEPII
jgi:hypothetical protein